MVGNGEKTAFWDDFWVGNEKFSVIFPWLYRNSLNKQCSVAMAGRWVGDEWVWGQGWRREFRAWEVDSLNNLVDLLKCRKTIADEPDRWIWEPEASEIYLVKSGYRKILERKLELINRANKTFKLLWNNWAAPKAQATAWRVISRRTATKTELRKRGAIPLFADLKCTLCGSAEESIDHLFVECCKVWELWSSCLN